MKLQLISDDNVLLNSWYIPPEYTKSEISALIDHGNLGHCQDIYSSKEDYEEIQAEIKAEENLKGNNDEL